MSQPLSPAAQVVAWSQCPMREGFKCIPQPCRQCQRHGAAALRAAADQVVPEPLMIVEGGRTYEEAWTATVHDDIRRRFIAIAAELDGTSPTSEGDFDG